MPAVVNGLEVISEGAPTWNVDSATMAAGLDHSIRKFTFVVVKKALA